jgi:hypothetical protein
MKTRYLGLNRSNLLIALIFSTAISALSISPAFADRGWGGRGDHQEWRGGYGGRYQQPYGYGGRYPQPYGYAQPVYVPPPVYYPRQQSPGINLFLPLNLR